jgi:hypothetical protein
LLPPAVSHQADERPGETHPGRPSSRCQPVVSRAHRAAVAARRSRPCPT